MKSDKSLVVGFRISDSDYAMLKEQAKAESTSVGLYVKNFVYRLCGISVPVNISLVRRCELCGWEGVTDMHHKDGNHSNSDESNLQQLCPNCHRGIHWPTARPIKKAVNKLIVNGKVTVNTFTPTFRPAPKPDKAVSTSRVSAPSKKNPRPADLKAKQEKLAQLRELIAISGALRDKSRGIKDESNTTPPVYIPGMKPPPPGALIRVKLPNGKYKTMEMPVHSDDTSASSV